MKRFNDPRIELPTGPFVQFLSSSFVGSALAVHTIARDCIECVRDRKDARTNVDLLGF